MGERIYAVHINGVVNTLRGTVLKMMICRVKQSNKIIPGTWLSLVYTYPDYKNYECDIFKLSKLQKLKITSIL